MKILGVSLGRSATKSLAQFLSWNGFSIKHFYNIDEIEKGIFSEDLNGLNKYLESIDHLAEAFLDIPHSLSFEHFFKMHPDAKFIYIKRDIESWAKSMYEVSQIWAHDNENTLFEKAYCNLYIKTNKNKIQDLTIKELKDIWTAHDKKISEFFKNKDNFIEISLDDKEIENKLSSFLNITTKTNFPKINTIDSIRKKSFNGN